MLPKDFIFIERTTIPRKIKEITCLLTRYRWGAISFEDSEKLEEASIKIYSRLNPQKFKKTTPKVLTAGIIYCASLECKMKLSQQKIADIAFCTEVSLRRIKNKIIPCLPHDITTSG